MGKRGPAPAGEVALSRAERQARYRAARAAEAPRIKYRAPADRRGKAARWRAAVAELVALQAEYQAWFDGLPDSLRTSATGELLAAISDLDLAELEAVQPPAGFGRD